MVQLFARCRMKSSAQRRLPMELHSDGVQVVQRILARHKRYAGYTSANRTYSSTLEVLIGEHENAEILFEFYLRPSGRINLRLNNFTFYKHLKARSNAYRWSCTAYGSKWKCKAHLVITDKLEVLKANILHSHPPTSKRPDVRKIVDLKHSINEREIKRVGKIKSDIGTDSQSNYTLTSPLHNYLVAHSVFGTY
uniref:FLYWCH-type domain-containing protein n=2 Tax=Bombyx mori TaxID=7091 RepID=A0A8R2LVR9_BOMMO|nr:uncharacterized protein LOC119628614 isoform X2 [Bombyx mori]